MKSLDLYIQSALDSLADCTRELEDARVDVAEMESREDESPISTTNIDQVLAHCFKAQRELQALSKKVR